METRKIVTVSRRITPNMKERVSLPKFGLACDGESVTSVSAVEVCIDPPPSMREKKIVAVAPEKWRPGKVERERGNDTTQNKWRPRKVENSTVRVSNLEPSATAHEVRALCDKIGMVLRVHVVRDGGVAYVTFGCKEEAEAAIRAIRGTPHGYMILHAEFARPRQ